MLRSVLTSTHSRLAVAFALIKGLAENAVDKRASVSGPRLSGMCA